jgi:hypothetical protein
MAVVLTDSSNELLSMDACLLLLLQHSHCCCKLSRQQDFAADAAGQ